MGVLSNAMKGGIISEATRGFGTNQTTVGKVETADEKNNMCRVTFISQSGKKVTGDHFAVDLKAGDWFPKQGDKVLIEAQSDDGGMIVSQYTEDYNKDVRSQKKLKNDNLNDGDGSCCGGNIL